MQLTCPRADPCEGSLAERGGRHGRVSPCWTIRGADATLPDLYQERRRNGQAPAPTQDRQQEAQSPPRPPQAITRPLYRSVRRATCARTRRVIRKASQNAGRLTRPCRVAAPSPTYSNRPPSGPRKQKPASPPLFLEACRMREEFTAHLEVGAGEGARRGPHPEPGFRQHRTPPARPARGRRLRSRRRAAARRGGADELRKKLTAALPRGGEPPVVTGTLPLSPKARAGGERGAGEGAGQPALRVSSRLLLCSLLDECETAVRAALRDAGADIEHLQRLLMQRDGSIAPED